MLDYLPLYPEIMAQLKRYNEIHRCRLYEAMAQYAFTGEEPQWPEEAPEWFIWESLRQHVERVDKKVNQNKANASKGERTEAKPSEQKRKKAEASEPERTEAKPSETPIYETKTEIETEIDNDNGNSARAWLSESEAQEALDHDRQIEDAAKTWGLPCNEGHMLKARDLAHTYSLPWLLRAIETAGNGKEQTWRYVSGILKSWKDNGGPDAPKKQRAAPVKTVSAQQYGQRHYTEDELLSVSDDLIAEARRARETA